MLQGLARRTCSFLCPRAVHYRHHRLSMSSLELVDQLITKVATATIARAHDAAWRPSVPLGHTEYSWGLIAEEVPVEQKQAPQKKQQKKKQKKEKKVKPQAAPVVDNAPAITKISCLVGTIVECSKHPDADKMYLESIDLGEECGPRQIVSGLVDFIPLSDMIGARVVVVANLKPAKLRGVLSSGMVLAASNDDHTEVALVTPPAGVPNGARVIVAGMEEEHKEYAALPQVNPKKKVNAWMEVCDKLMSNDSGVATFDGKALQVDGLDCTTSLKNAHIR